MIYRLSFLFFFLSCLQLSGQSSYGVGEWKYHYPFNFGQHIDASPSKVYLANSNSLFALDINDNSFETYSKLDGLSGSDFTTISYNEDEKALYIGYSSGIVDILFDNEIIHLVDLYRSDFTGTKTINHFTFKNNLVYISSDFGIIVYDPFRREIKETYKNIGPSGQEVKAYKTVIIDNNNIYSLTNLGLLASNINSGNLLDFNNWTLQESSVGIDPTWELTDISWLENRAILSTKENGLYQTESNSTWTLLPDITITNENHRLKHATDHILLIDQNTITNIYDDLTTTSITSEKTLTDACYENDQLWLSTSFNGIGKYDVQKSSYYAPNGPTTSAAYGYGTHGDTFYALPGYMNRRTVSGSYATGYYLYKNSNWSLVSFNDIFSLKSIAKMQYQESTGRLYFASQNFGLLYQEPDGTYGLINDTSKIYSAGTWINSPIPYYFPATRVMGLDVDPNDNLWFVTYGISNDFNLFCITRDKEFLSFQISSSDMIYANDLQCDNAGNVWIQTRNSIIIYQPSTGGFRVLKDDFFNGAIPLCMAIDKLGDLWVGTNKGIQILFDPPQITRTDNYGPSYPFFGSQPLLIEESINHIYVAGGNKKWISTNEGAWLVNQDGSDIIENFTAENSAIPSDKVVRIGVNDITGEVFFTLENGMVSYWGDATAGEPEHSPNVKIFPNPVEPGFSGEVGITGLAENAIVKITDIAGRLVRELYANGGMVTWDTKDVNGSKVSSGVYMVFSSDPTGNDTFVGKIVVIE